MNKPGFRIIFTAIMSLVIMGFFAYRLMNIQIVNAEEHKKKILSNSQHEQVIKATRGEIVDKNGDPFAENVMGYDVVIDRAMLPRDRENDILLELTRLFDRLGEEWIDNLPVTKSTPFQYLPNRENDVARLKRFVNVNEYATAEDVVSWLESRYRLDEYAPRDKRRIAGIKYEMEQRGFNPSVQYTFAKNIGISSVIQIKELSYQLPGVDIIESTVRQNPSGELAPHLIGLTGPIYKEEYEELKQKGYAMNDIIGKSGSELAFEEYLRGTDGLREIFTDHTGKVIKVEETRAPVPGNTVRLTIDKNLQLLAQEALERQIKNLRETARPREGREANHGAAVAIEVKTGKVLACATYPSYDLNRYLEDYAELASDEVGTPLLNRALFGAYAPGSSFKPVVGTAAIGTELIGSGSTYLCNRVFTLPGSPQRFTCLGSHGNTNLYNAMRVSCNIFFYNAGLHLGIDKVDETARMFGLGEPTGIELTERVGYRSNPETKQNLGAGEWFPGDTLQSSIGQLYNAVTPIQLANYTATIANRGTRMKLTFVDEILDYAGKETVKASRPVVAEQLPYPREVFETVISGMVAASGPSGTARVFSYYPVSVASKTGTPETSDLCNSVFIAFAPAEDPEIAIAVVIENGWHGFTSAPVARDLFNEYFGFNQ